MSTFDHPLSVTTLDLINTGILMGFIHVLTGPDHLAAVATLVGTSLSSSSSSTTEGRGDQGRRMSNFLLGIKWGIGHSIGLLVVGSILIAIESGGSTQWISMDDTIQFVLDIIVGLAMLCLGCYGMIRAMKHRNEHEDVEFNNRREIDDKEEESIELNKTISSPSSRRASSTTTRRSNSGRGSKSSSRKSRSNSNSIREEEEDSNLLSTAAAQDEDSSFFKDPEMAMDYRRASMEIIHQMSEVLNRDGDSLRRGDSTVVDPSDTADVEKRILAAAKSLHQNSDLSNDRSKHGKSKRSTPSSSDEEQGGLKRNISEEQFLRTLKASAKGALSKSFMAILSDERTSGAQPLSANSLMNKVVDDQHHSILEEMSGSHSTRSGTLLRRCLSSSCCCASSGGRSCSPGLLAFLVGIIQGVAGTSAVLGVIPAVQLENPKFSAIYLTTFCFTSTLVMGAFAFFYGFFSSWLAGGSAGSSLRGRRRSSDDLSSSGSRVFVVEAGSAVLSVAVGIIWLVLLSVGNLEPLRSRI